jgi:hypothetical protein
LKVEARFDDALKGAHKAPFFIIVVQVSGLEVPLLAELSTSFLEFSGSLRDISAEGELDILRLLIGLFGFGYAYEFKLDFVTFFPGFIGAYWSFIPLSLTLIYPGLLHTRMKSILGDEWALSEEAIPDEVELFPAVDDDHFPIWSHANVGSFRAVDVKRHRHLTEGDHIVAPGQLELLKIIYIAMKILEDFIFQRLVGVVDRDPSRSLILYEAHRCNHGWKHFTHSER